MRLSPKISFIAVAMAISTPAVIADEPKDIKANFCDDISGSCEVIRVQNVSSAVVTSVRIEQEKKKSNGCEKRSDRVTENLVGSNDGDSWRYYANANCTYQITFKVTDGCEGENKQKITPKQMGNDRRRVLLLGACGSLKAKLYEGGSRLEVEAGP